MLFSVTLSISLPALKFLPLFELSEVPMVSIVDTSGVACSCCSITFLLCNALFCFLQNPGRIPKTESKILDRVHGLLASLTKNLCSLGSALYSYFMLPPV